MYKYKHIVDRGYKKWEQKLPTWMALACCFLIALSFCVVFKPYLAPQPSRPLKLWVSVDVGDLKNALTVKEISTATTTATTTTNSHSQPSHNSKGPSKRIELLCSIREIGSDYCMMENEIRIHGTSATVFIASSQKENRSWIIRPYARKYDRVVIRRAREWSVKPATDAQLLPHCTQNHSVPAMLFSTGGYAGNIFHDFSDIIIPLYINSRQFNGQVQFFITNKHSWWINKYQNILKSLSKYDVIDIDNDDDVHCFPRGIIGLKRHDKELNIDPSISPYSISDFRRFVRSSFSLQKDSAIKMNDGEKRKPRLLIISRKQTRAFTNADEIAQMAASMGYDIVVSEANENLSRFAETVNTCDVFLAVHGAGLTNMIFLPDKAVLIQVVPFGGFEWLARTDYEEPARAMKLRYLEYKIKLEESTLIEQYPLDHQVIRNPSSIGKQGWNAFRSIYMTKQNVKIDLNRFRSTLSKALQLLH